jgi:hypothetical protein
MITSASITNNSVAINFLDLDRDTRSDDTLMRDQTIEEILDQAEEERAIEEALDRAEENRILAINEVQDTDEYENQIGDWGWVQRTHPLQLPEGCHHDIHC